MAMYLMRFSFANLNVVVEESDYNNYFIASFRKGGKAKRIKQ